MLAAIAYIHHATGNLVDALADYHRSLALQPDNTLVTELYNLCLLEAYAPDKL